MRSDNEQTLESIKESIKKLELSRTAFTIIDDAISLKTHSLETEIRPLKEKVNAKQSRMNTLASKAMVRVSMGVAHDLSKLSPAEKIEYEKFQKTRETLESKEKELKKIVKEELGVLPITISNLRKVISMTNNALDKMEQQSKQQQQRKINQSRPISRT